MAYYGPADEARCYFYEMGYEPTPRQTTADFLVSITDPCCRMKRSPGARIPRTAAEFAAHFQISALAQANRYNIQSYRNKCIGKGKRTRANVSTKHLRPKSPYMISIPMQAKAVIIRRIQILWGMKADKAVEFLSV